MEGDDPITIMSFIILYSSYFSAITHTCCPFLSTGIIGG